MKSVLTGLIALLISSNAMALEISGPLQQGGFIIGKTVPEAELTFGKYKTTAGADGTFVFGIPRNQEENSEISIMLMQGIEEKHALKIKQREYKVQKIKGVAKRKVNPYKEDLPTIKSDSKKIKAARAVFKELPHLSQAPIKPTEGRTSGVYGSKRVFNGEERSWHKGMDIAAPTGTPVHAPTDATVRLALENSFFNGNLIILDHGYQLMSIYAHLDSMNVKVGDKVKQGDLIGKVGTTGRSTGPHLHWGLYWRNMALDPFLWLNEKKD